MILEPFYFGQNNSCFGHFTPTTGFTQGKSVLIVPSIFGEAIRSHRVLREVARSLSGRGYDVLRFDFDGDGNSCSDTANISVQVWLKNIQDAHAELVKRSTNSCVSVLATRFGAGLALVALKNIPIDSMVLWDPLLSKNEMYNIFVGPKPINIENESPTSRNPFGPQTGVRGFQEVGLGEVFADDFLKLDDITFPDCDLKIVGTADVDTEIQNMDITSNLFKVEHRCNWSTKDLPVIFAPKLISAICECF